MKRRSFIKYASQAVALPLILNGQRLSAITQPALMRGINSENDRILVLLRLNGGNDGLNTIIPLDQYDNLAQVRNNILLPENSLLGISDVNALHPVMQGIQQLFENERAGIIQNVGYPNQNRSHFRSTDIWTSGSPADENWSTGWLGRYMDDLYPGYPEAYPNDDYPDPFAINMGSSVVSNTCQGGAANYSLALADPFSLSPVEEGEGGEVPDTPYGEELQFIRTTILQTNAYSEVVTAAAEQGANAIDYPEDNRFAQQLRNIALLISGGLQTKIYIATLGGFDTHADQVVAGDVSTGEHAALLNSLSSAVAAFQADLQALGLEERVITMTFSEFGRRIRSNDSLGTDHGTAAPLMVFGSCVNPQILGDNPEISADIGIDEGVPMQYDFRDVYGSILMDWFEVEENLVRSLLHDDFNYLPVLRNCSTATSSKWVNEAITINHYPNPVNNWLNVEFTSEREWCKVSLFDSLGSELRTVMNKQISEGPHKIQLDMHELKAGPYFVRIQLGQRVRTVRVVKV